MPTIGHVLAASRAVRGVLAAGAGGAAFVGAYDAFTASLAHVYEPARRTLTSYTGPLVRLRRGSDSAESDFSYIANGDLDTVAITTWLGGASGYVVTVYDQKIDDHIAQADAAKQPLYVASAKNGHAGALFDGFGDNLQGNYSGALSQPYNIFAVAQLDAAAVLAKTSEYICDGSSVVARTIIAQYVTTGNSAMFCGAWIQGGAMTSDWLLFSAVMNGATSSLFRNGALDASGNAGTQNALGITVGTAYNGASAPFNGHILPIIVCDPALSGGDRAAMETAINSYWAVF